MREHRRASRPRPWLWLIRLISWIVPGRFRKDWRQEWEAELQHHESLLAAWRRSAWRDRSELLRHSLGSLRDALLLQPKRLEEEMFQDLRYGARMLIKQPGFSAIAVLTLALGIGANAAVFSFVNAFLLRPLPFKQPDQLVHLWGTDRRQGFDQLRVSLPNYLDWKAQNTVFADLGVFNYTEENLSAGAEAERVNVGRISANVFDLLGAQPAVGRTFQMGEDKAGHGQVVVLSHRFWQRRFGGRSQVLGQTINLNEGVYTIIGVMPPEFAFPLLTTEIWAPRLLDPAQSSREQRFLQVFGRMKRGVTIAQAQAEMNVIAGRLEKEYAKENAGSGVSIEPLQNALNFADDVIRPMSVVLVIAVAFVLLIACANVASLMLSRAVGRAREIAIRSALGAGCLRIIRQLLTESLLVSLLGGALGLALASWAVNGMAQVIPEDLYRVGQIAVERQALVFTLALCLLTTFLFGLAPALQASKPNLNESLKEGGAAGVGRRRQRLHSLLVVGEIGLSLALLAGAALMIQTFLRMQRANAGFQSRSVLTMKLILTGPRYAADQSKAAFHRQVIEAITAQPGVISAATVNYLPLNHEYDVAEFDLAGRPAAADKALTATSIRISPDYFNAMGIPVLRGRAFTARDDEGREPGVSINQALAERFLPNADPVGQRLVLKQREQADRAVSILGVAGDTRHAELNDRTEWQIYFPMGRQPERYFYLVVRTTSDPQTAIAAARSAINSVDRTLPITAIRPLAQVVEEFLLPQCGLSIVLIILAAGALLLATVGIYGVISNFVNQRRREIGIRMALGACANDILRLVIGQGMRLVLIGVLIGLAMAVGLTRLMTGLLFGVNATDPFTFAGVALLLAAVALLACCIPARRAVKTDPTAALRCD